MNAPPPARGRLRSYLLFVVAVFYFFMARSLARHSALAFTSQWNPLAEQIILALLLLLGYGAMGYWFSFQNHPFSEQGLPRRSDFTAEFGTGLATGWGIALVCVLPMAFAGGIAISIASHLADWLWLPAEIVFFALVALVEEIAFRGYGFQRFMDAVGPIGATIGFAAFYGIVQALQPGATHLSFTISIVFSILLSVVYLRTRALWFSWCINFGWKASRALLFGLAISGVNSHSPVVQGDPMGSFWLTGGGFGLDGTWVALIAMLLAFPVVFRLTRDLDYIYNAPVLIPGGIPVDLDAAARAQHDAAMGPAAPVAPAASGLVQIAPIAAPPPPPDRPNGSS